MVVGVLPNLDKRGAVEIVDKMSVIFRNNGITALLPDSVCASGYKLVPKEDICKLSDIIITVGGDGTIIRYAKLAAQYDKAVLGINAGRLGFLAMLESNQLDLLQRLKTGEYKVEERVCFDITVTENGNEIGKYSALNDVVITSGFISRLIDITAFIDNDSITYRADGLIISTPTGSTAYSMSAGGPIVDPTTDNIILTPICSHSLNAKPVIFSANKEIGFTATTTKRCEIYLSVDGRKALTIKPDMRITVKKSKNSVKLIKLTDRSFYSTVSEKFR